MMSKARLPAQSSALWQPVQFSSRKENCAPASAMREKLAASSRACSLGWASTAPPANSSVSSEVVFLIILQTLRSRHHAHVAGAAQVSIETAETFVQEQVGRTPAGHQARRGIRRHDFLGAVRR